VRKIIGQQADSEYAKKNSDQLTDSEYAACGEVMGVWKEGGERPSYSVLLLISSCARSGLFA